MWSIRIRVAAVVYALAVLAGCNEEGGNGQPCQCNQNPWVGTETVCTCNSGLTCSGDNVCEPPQPVACGTEPDGCATGLVCANATTSPMCVPQSEAAWCFGIYCAPGFVCFTEKGMGPPLCVAADAGSDGGGD
jgi:hypothetical protein